MRRRPLLLGLLALLGSMLVAGAALPAGAGGSKPPTVPERHSGPGRPEGRARRAGKGVQIYDCKPQRRRPCRERLDVPGAGGRALRPPRAPGRHPLRRPHLRVVRRQRRGRGAPESRQPDPTAIPWLLLEADANRGDGVLAQVGYVQRLETRGGVAPAEACDPGEDATLAVPYRARYVFYAD